MGICIVTAQAASVGVTAIPHPVTDAAWGGWLVHQFLASKILRFSGVGFDNRVYNTVEIDSKGVRKIDEDERLVVIFENTSAADGFEVAASFRFLTKIH